MILNAKEVDDLMKASLQDTEKFKQLHEDPRDQIKQTIKVLCANMQKKTS